MTGKFRQVFYILLLALQLTAAVAWGQQLPKDFDSTRFLGVSAIPSNLAPWLFYEQIVNDRKATSHIADLDHSNLDPRFDPKNRPVVKIGYLEIPLKQAWFRVEEKGLSKAAKKVLFVEKNGVRYIRFFMHPLMEDKYKPEIQRWGNNGKPFYGEFIASLTSSLRSFVVWNRERPEEFVGQKASLAVVVQVDRKNDIDKLERAYAISKLVEEVTDTDKQALKFDFFSEPIIQNTSKMERGGKQYGNITRDFKTEMVHPNGRVRYIPGFALTSVGSGGERPLLFDMIEKSRMSPEKFIRTRIIEPMMKSYAYLTFQHGIVGEPHQQNLLFELDENGQLTGKTIYRDLDAFKPDIEMRHIRGLSDEPFLEPTRPYKVLKMGKAEEDYARSYDTYVRSSWGEILWMANRQWSVKKPDQKVANFPELMDKAYITEMVRYLGFEAVFGADNMETGSTLKEFVKTNLSALKNLVPEVDWQAKKLEVSAEQTAKIFKRFSVGQMFRRYKTNTFGSLLFDPNAIVAKFKDASLADQKPQADIDQALLRREYERLTFNFRSSTKTPVPQSGIFVLNGGSITAFRKNGKVLGHAFLEPRSALESNKSFYSDSRYPRVSPNKKTLKMLYDYSDRQAQERNQMHDQAQSVIQPQISEVRSAEVIELPFAAPAAVEQVTRTCRDLFAAAR